MEPSNLYPRLVVDKGQYNFMNSDGKTISSRWFDYAEEFKDGFAKVRIENAWNKIYGAWDHLAGFCWYYAEGRSYYINRSIAIIYHKTWGAILLFLFSIGILIIFFGPPLIFLHSIGYNISGEGENDPVLGITIAFFWYILYGLHSYSQENMYYINLQGKVINKQGFHYLGDFNQKGLAKVGKEFGLPFNKKLYNYIDGAGHSLGTWFREGQDPIVESEENKSVLFKDVHDETSEEKPGIKYISNDTDWGELYLRFGDENFLNEDYEKALGCFEEASERIPDNYPARFGKGQTLLKMRRTQEALDVFMSLNSDTSRDIDTRLQVYNLTGFCYLLLGNKDPAKNYFDLVLQFDSNNEQAQMYLNGLDMTWI